MIVRSAFLVFVLVTSAAGQETRGAIQGRVSDPSGACRLCVAILRVLEAQRLLPLLRAASIHHSVPQAANGRRLQG